MEVSGRQKAINELVRSSAASEQARYPAIADHGLIGDLQTAALVTTDGVIDWFCSPRFDSPSIFAGLLDAQRGVSEEIGPTGEQLGNFPQAFSHLALINAAVTLDRALDAHLDRG